MASKKKKWLEGKEEVILSAFVVCGTIVSLFSNAGFGLIVGLSGIAYYIWKTMDVFGGLNYGK